MKTQEFGSMTRAKWLKWRQSGIGSSDAPAIHGKSPWATPRDVAKSKWEKDPKEKKSNWAMDTGNKIEPILRLKFAQILSKEFGINDVEFVAKNISMASNPYLLASCDGIFEMKDEEGQTIRIGMEAKFIGKDKIHTLNNAQEGAPFEGVPEYYWIQMQHQYMVANLDHNFFVCTSEDKIESITEETIHWKRVNRDDDWLAKTHVPVCTEFWKCVKSKKLPKPSREDVETVTQKEVVALAKAWKKANEQKKKAEKSLEAAREKLLKKCKNIHSNVLVDGVKIYSSEKLGAIDYDKIPELKGVDLDQYREPGPVNYEKVPELATVDLNQYRKETTITWTVKS